MTMSSCTKPRPGQNKCGRVRLSCTRGLTSSQRWTSMTLLWLNGSKYLQPVPISLDKTVSLFWNEMLSLFSLCPCKPLLNPWFWKVLYKWTLLLLIYRCNVLMCTYFWRYICSSPSLSVPLFSPSLTQTIFLSRSVAACLISFLSKEDQDPSFPPQNNGLFLHSCGLANKAKSILFQNGPVIVVLMQLPDWLKERPDYWHIVF